MESILAIFQTLQGVVALGILAIIPALYIASLLRFIPWPASSLAMAVVAALVAYPSGLSDGSGTERARWEIKIHNLRAAMGVKKHQAELAGLAIEEKYLKAEREKSLFRQGKDRALVNLMRSLPTQLESKSDETSLCPRAPICQPYNMLAWPSILQNIKGR